jgi:hypothetical protein
LDIKIKSNTKGLSNSKSR